MVAWNDAGDGLVLQVTTPSWPGSGSHQYRRAGDNTLGCIAEPDDVMVSQSFFSVKLNHDGVLQVLKALCIVTKHRSCATRKNDADSLVKRRTHPSRSCANPL